MGEPAEDGRRSGCRRASGIVLALCALLALEAPGQGFDGEPIRAQRPGLGSSGDRFGSALALDGERLWVGVPGGRQLSVGDSAGIATGMVLAFARADPADGPVLTLAPEAPAGAAFGAALARCGVWLVVGAPFEDGNRGAHFLYRIEGGVATLVQRRVGEVAGGRHGTAVACDGLRLAVAAPFADRVEAWTLPPEAAPMVLSGAAGSRFGSAIGWRQGELLVVAAATGRLLRHSADGALLGEITLAEPGLERASLASDDGGVAVGLPEADGGRGQVSWVPVAGGVPQAPELLGGVALLPGDGFGSALALLPDRLAVGAEGRDGGEGAVHGFRRLAGVWQPAATLSAADGGRADLLGAALAADATWLVSGAPLSDLGGSALGRGFLGSFAEPASPTLGSQLALGDSGALERYGSVLASDGVLLAVGVPLADTARGFDAGRVEVLDPAKPQTRAVVSAEDGRDDAQFGRALALADGRLLIGAPRDPVAGVIDRGSAYVFRLTGTAPAPALAFEAKLVADTGGERDQFGFAVALSGDLAAVGVPGALSDFVGAGSVDVFRWNGSTWTRIQRLTPPTPVFGLNYGAAVAFSGTRLLVGSPFESVAGIDAAGRVHVYAPVADGFQLEASLTAPVPVELALFGFALASDGSRLAVGAPLDAEGALRPGVAYLYATTTAGNPARLVPPTPLDGENFGIALGLAGQLVAVGASNGGFAGTPALGSVTVFRQQGDEVQRLRRLRPAGPYSAAVGRSVLLIGDEVYAGAPLLPRITPEQGAVLRARVGVLSFADGFEP